MFRAKLPLVLILGAEGIAVGMSTKILPHNIREVIEAEKKCLRGEKFTLYPDFQTGGLIDVSDYQDGLGKIVTRAKMDLSDEKKITITELPFGSTTESLMDSIEKAAKNNKVRIASINDYTAESVNIEIKVVAGLRQDLRVVVAVDPGALREQAVGQVEQIGQDVRPRRPPQAVRGVVQQAAAGGGGGQDEALSGRVDLLVGRGVLPVDAPGVGGHATLHAVDDEVGVAGRGPFDGHGVPQGDCLSGHDQGSFTEKN